MSALTFFVFAVCAVASLIGIFAHFTLISRLRDSFPAYYRQVGSPGLTAVFTSAVDVRWNVFVLTRAFARLPETPAELRGHFEFAFLVTWIQLLALAAFAVILVLGSLGF